MLQSDEPFKMTFRSEFWVDTFNFKIYPEAATSLLVSSGYVG